jgi:hypothetical protein
MNPVFLSSPTLMFLPDRWAFDIIAKAGFSGVELLLTKHTLRHLDRRLFALTDRGLDFSVHRWWPRGEGAHNKKFIHELFFPADNVSLLDKLPFGAPYPVVVSSYERYSMDEYLNVPMALFQPTPTGPEVVPFNDLKEWMKRKNVRVVFDLGHWLQYVYWPKPVPFVWGEDCGEILSVLMTEFLPFKNQIKEIHLYDIDTFTASGMNRLPGKGYHLLKKFLLFLKTIGWEGRIVWEIDPRQVFPNKICRLKELPVFVREVGL